MLAGREEKQVDQRSRPGLELRLLYCRRVGEERAGSAGEQPAEDQFLCRVPRSPRQVPSAVWEVRGQPGTSSVANPVLGGCALESRPEVRA